MLAIAIFFGIALIAFVAAMISLYKESKEKFPSFEKEDFRFKMWMISAIAFVISVFLFLVWISAGHKADIINNKFGTDYTTNDIFWAEETIERVIEGEKHRVDIEE